MGKQGITWQQIASIHAAKRKEPLMSKKKKKGMIDGKTYMQRLQDKRQPEGAKPSAQSDLERTAAGLYYEVKRADGKISLIQTMLFDLPAATFDDTPTGEREALAWLDAIKDEHFE